VKVIGEKALLSWYVPSYLSLPSKRSTSIKMEGQEGQRSGLKEMLLDFN
jgi:hypothetical protein